jgi:hypothetical protein
VGEAQRIATMQMKESEKKKGKRRGGGDEGEDADQVVGRAVKRR